MIYTATYNSPLGGTLLAQEDEALIGLWFKGQKYFFGNLKAQAEEKETPLLLKTKAWLARYFAGDKPRIDELALSPRGGDFRQEVWKILCEIPYGQTMTYGEIAKLMARRTGKESMSAQAVGGAVGHNPISIIIPCHRVVGAKGSLTGYASGIDNKVKLLMHEGINTQGLLIPKKGGAL